MASTHAVPLDHFDPEGVHELRRTFTQQSLAATSKAHVANASVPEIRVANNENGRGVRSDGGSTATAVSDLSEQHEFDFEERLKQLTSQYV